MACYGIRSCTYLYEHKNLPTAALPWLICVEVMIKLIASEAGVWAELGNMNIKTFSIIVRHVISKSF